MAASFEQIPFGEIPQYEGEFATDTGLESVGEVTPPGQGSPNFPDRTEWGQEPDPVITVLQKRGANLAVIEGLKGISFVPGSSCGMSQAIAYIRYWSKKGVTEQTPVEQEGQEAIPEDPQEKIREEVEDNYSETNTTQTNEQQAPSTRIVLTVPENTAYQSRPRQPVPTRVVQSEASPKAGKVVSANPSGNTSVPGVTPSAAPSDAVWTFLFNPEELQLSYGPDYNRAETWGVSDWNNSGQPLSWRSNRNRKLSFGKVLLHGYSFGKRVDALEAGLQQLFLARDGENGSDGPPVLEFVWGIRHFGPCVIQNIQVREKAWDKGILVNAEVSFELEQVPEWTINDGFVDVLRPGRQPTINDPVLPRGEYNQPEGDPEEDEKPANQPGGGSPKPTSKNNPILCNTALVASQNFQKVVNLGDEYLGLLKFPFKRRFDVVESEYSSSYSKYRNVIETIAKPALISKSPGCFRMDGNGNIAMRELVVDGDYARGIRFARGCAVNIKTTLDQWVAKESQGGKCDSLRKGREAAEEAEKAKSEAAKKAAEQRKRAQEEKQKCKRFENKVEIDQNGIAVNILPECSHSQLGSQTTCLGKVYVCKRYTRSPGQGWKEQ